MKNLTTLTIEEAREYAKRYLVENGTKLKKTKIKEGKVIGPIYKHIVNGKEQSFILPCSFVKASEGVYAVGEMLGKGSFGKVKKLTGLDTKGNETILAMKIQKQEVIEKLLRGGSKEIAITQELGFLKHAFVHNEKFYQNFEFVGTPLDVYLSKTTLTMDQKYELAIKMLLAVAELHKRGYAHLDIKPENMTIDEKGDIHLIDFGLSESNPQDARKATKGTPIYLPYESGETSPLYQKEKLDMLAALRVCFMPVTINAYGVKGKKTASIQSIFTQQDLDNDPGLCALLDTRFIGEENTIDKPNAVVNELPDALALVQELTKKRCGAFCTSFDSIGLVNLLFSAKIQITPENILLAKNLKSMGLMVTQETIDASNAVAQQAKRKEKILDVLLQNRNIKLNEENRRLASIFQEKKLLLTKESIKCAKKLIRQGLPLNDNNLNATKRLWEEALPVNKRNIGIYTQLKDKNIPISGEKIRTLSHFPPLDFLNKDNIDVVVHLIKNKIPVNNTLIEILETIKQDNADVNISSSTKKDVILELIKEHIIKNHLLSLVRNSIPVTDENYDNITKDTIRKQYNGFLDHLIYRNIPLSNKNIKTAFYLKKEQKELKAISEASINDRQEKIIAFYDLLDYAVNLRKAKEVVGKRDNAMTMDQSALTSKESPGPVAAVAQQPLAQDSLPLKRQKLRASFQEIYGHKYHLKNTKNVEENITNHYKKMQEVLIAEQKLMESFQDAYRLRLVNDKIEAKNRSYFFGGFKAAFLGLNTKIKNKNLTEIIKEAVKDANSNKKDRRTIAVMKQLQWMDKDGRLTGQMASIFPEDTAPKIVHLSSTPGKK